MKKTMLSLFALVASFGLMAADSGTTSGSMNNQQQMMTGSCGQLTQDEQKFASQIVDTNNQTMFCSQFTPQQRQQAMQLLGQPDSTGNMMNADQAVQQTMSTLQQKPAATSGCPGK